MSKYFCLLGGRILDVSEDDIIKLNEDIKNKNGVIKDNLIKLRESIFSESEYDKIRSYTMPNMSDIEFVISLYKNR